MNATCPCFLLLLLHCSSERVASDELRSRPECCEVGCGITIQTKSIKTNMVVFILRAAELAGLYHLDETDGPTPARRVLLVFSSDQPPINLFLRCNQLEFDAPMAF